MLAAERHAKILELVKEKGSVQVEELATDLGVSAMTIRRDLIKLQESRQLERCHGGAVIKQEPSYSEKQIHNMKEKEQIAEVCASLVSQGDTVFLDAGTTTYGIARKIQNMPGITIVTNDLEIAQLVRNSSAELIICGGVVEKPTGSIVGYYASRMLQDFRFDIGFFGATSINSDFQVMTPTIDKAHLKRDTVRQCEASYLAVDESKFDRQALVFTNHLSNFTGIVTTKQFTPEETERLNQLNINILSANEI